MQVIVAAIKFKQWINLASANIPGCFGTFSRIIGFSEFFQCFNHICAGPAIDLLYLNFADFENHQ